MSEKIETIDVGKVNWNATAVQYMELNKQKTEAIQRVRKLHNKDQHGYCHYCYGYMGTTSFYPCPTIVALDGDTNE